jgi:hypothetical protein
VINMHGALGTLILKEKKFCSISGYPWRFRVVSLFSFTSFGWVSLAFYPCISVVPAWFEYVVIIPVSFFLVQQLLFLFASAGRWDKRSTI